MKNLSPIDENKDIVTKEYVDPTISQVAINRTTLGYRCKNLLNETGFLSSITSVTRGTKSISGNQITLTATAADCYTKPNADSDGGYKIPVEPNTDYIISWESDNSNSGLVYIFMNGDTSSSSNRKAANNNGSKRFKFTTNSDTTFITIRLGVLVSGNSITYSNIMLRYADILDDTYESYKESVDERINALNKNFYINYVDGKSTSNYYAYGTVCSGVMIYVAPEGSGSDTGGIYFINAHGSLITLVEKTGIVIEIDTSNYKFRVTNNTSKIMCVIVQTLGGGVQV